MRFYFYLVSFPMFLLHYLSCSYVSLSSLLCVDHLLLVPLCFYQSVGLLHLQLLFLLLFLYDILFPLSLHQTHGHFSRCSPLLLSLLLLHQYFVCLYLFNLLLFSLSSLLCVDHLLLCAHPHHKRRVQQRHLTLFVGSDRLL